MRKGIYDIIINTPERFIGKYKKHRISIVKVENTNTLFELDVRDEKENYVLECLSYVPDMGTAIESAIEKTNL